MNKQLNYILIIFNLFVNQ